MSDWPFVGLEPNGYRLIYADPPWSFSCGGTRNPRSHYSTMSIRDIAALPVGKLAHPEGCRLYLWVTMPILLLPFGPRECLKAWGFRYSTSRVWAKLWPREDGMVIYPNSLAKGTGFEVNGNAELLIIAKKGRPPRVPPGQQPTSIFYGRRQQHSRKPGFVADELARMFPGPRVELFAREARPGWSAWGAETSKFNAAEVAA